MLLSTCPNCGAKFKVLPDQLSVRQGRVMCGRCRHVFNAFESLKRVDDEQELIDYRLLSPVALEAPSSSVDTPPAAEQAHQPSRSATILPPLPIDETMSAHSEQAAEGRDTPLAENASPPAFDSFESAVEKLERAVTEPLESLDTTSPVEQRVDPVWAATSSTGIADGRRDSEPRPALLTERAELPLDNPLINSRLPEDAPPSRLWAWFALLAGLALLLQAVYFYRSALVQQFPEARAFLTMACEPLGCAIPWGRDAALIDIPASELIEPPGRPGQILLSVTLLNRAKTKQDFPALQIKLTDSTNAVVTNRVLFASEYLGRNPAASEGLAPNTELYVNLNLELTGKVTASGYEVRALYP